MGGPAGLLRRTNIIYWRKPKSGVKLGAFSCIPPFTSASAFYPFYLYLVGYEKPFAATVVYSSHLVSTFASCIVEPFVPLQTLPLGSGFVSPSYIFIEAFVTEYFLPENVPQVNLPHVWYSVFGFLSRVNSNPQRTDSRWELQANNL